MSSCQVHDADRLSVDQVGFVNAQSQSCLSSLLPSALSSGSTADVADRWFGSRTQTT